MGHMQLPKRLLAAVLAGALTFTQAAAFLDTSGHWAEDAISKWSEEYGMCVSVMTLVVVAVVVSIVIITGSVYHPGSVCRYSGSLFEISDGISGFCIF